MKKTKYIFILFFMCLHVVWSQTILIEGQINSSNDVENIHIINKTEQKFTITNQKGEFQISVKVNDTLVVSSIQNKLKTLVINKTHILSKKITITLDEQINQLDEVVVGKILTGDLAKDLQNVEGKAVTSKSLGIPSYQGPLKTQNERQLNEATTGSGLIPLFPIINAISGRTKKLKLQIKLERREELMYEVKTRLSEDLFKDNPLHEDYIMDYFYFVSDDEKFTAICSSKSDLEILVFLKEKLKQYKNNQKQNED
ncbi:hypothetical protein ACFS5M_05040 [Lacinutrix iliipiscaria]|uniref:CarboxypepD_reg-like domain-containing protein n=1 Tax=Lacinutrix iliipiscaria TaxID=1230532 RepID=A0ABW5WK19_9FLAO